MSTAQSIFLVYGVAVLAYGFILGIPMAMARMKAPQAPRHLVTTHLSAIMQGPVHLGLAYAVGFIDMGSTWVLTAAWLIVGASILEITGGTVNWLSGAGDQFAEKSVGMRLNSLVGPPAIIGIAIILVGIIGAL